MRLGYPAEPATLDPLGRGGGSTATRDILRPVLPALFRLGPGGRVEADLAASVPGPGDITIDPPSVRIELSEASWSDGEPITSADVRFSWERLLDGPTGYRYRDLSDVETPDARTVVLRFDRPVRRWWSLFSVDDMVLPEHAYSEAWRDGPTVSGGPFAVEGWTEGLEVRLRRNPRWRQVVPLAGIDVRFVPNDETRLQLLDRDELDLVWSEGETNMSARAGARGFELTDGPLDGTPGASSVFGPTWWELSLDPPALGPGLARAVVDASSPSLAAEILEADGRPLDGLPASFDGPGWAGTAPDAWAGRDDDPDPASGAFRLTFERGGTSGALATFLHFRLRGAGVTAELAGLQPDTFARDAVDPRTDPPPAVLRLRRGADAPDAASYLLGDPKVDGPIAESTGGLVEDGPILGLAGEAWVRATGALAGAAAVAPLVSARSTLIGDGVAGPRATGRADGPLWNAADWRAAS